ncbi:pilus assembly protein [Colwellia sp. TT2012]|uniref:pilus assembly protein n=1 Tax=Colwellia sp. TT2012 TaxID=1720342 RepID=UPI00070FAC37|nr:PilC/PilY family type IV pilus protein [Colwellia sp. TT2012]
MIKYVLVILFLVWSNQAFSDDIDLYVDNNSVTVQRPSVLIILDNSPSMVMFDINGNTLTDQSVNNPLSRAHLAREIIIDLINDNPDIDFALQLFNVNNTAETVNGGRIVFGLKNLSESTHRADLISILDSEPGDPTSATYTTFEGNGTPLCETLYETYRYLSGGNLYYGNHDTNTPLSIIATGSYTSPFADITCNKEITIIYITDGEPTIDTDANVKVATLTGTSTAGNYLGVLGSWMATRNWVGLTGDDDHLKLNTAIVDTDESAIVASVKIYTVGFGSGVTSATNLLELAARDGIAALPATSGKHASPAGGKYHAASTAEALKGSLGAILEQIMATSTLTSASVSSFDRIITSDAVYYGMFEPSNTARWQGNIKKYKIVNGEQKDANNNLAIDATGEFDKNAKSFWSAEVDGNDVNKGGVAEMLRTTATVDRKLLTDINGKGTLTVFSVGDMETKYKTNIPGTNNTWTNDTLTLFDIPPSEVADIPNHIKWAMGVDVDDDDNDVATIVRFDVFGDPLHSKPIVINYAVGGTRIVVGTNAGVLHMFKDVSDTEVIEKWAYLPKELFKNIKPLRQNTIAIDNKIYGLDGEITLHIKDLNSNGKVDPGDTAWLFFGLRRGGSSYYALDISLADTPKLMWHIKKTDPFAELGLTFSQPKVVKSALNAETDKLVVIFGGGYDIKKDGPGANLDEDEFGAAIYMVNAATGSYIFKMPTGAKNGIASSIASLDSDNDGFVDRLYVGDTGGNVWRVDMPDEVLLHSSIIQLASLAGTTDANDLRFFNQPDIVRTYILETYKVGTGRHATIVKQQVPYDAILLGSGDKATPTELDTNDVFFMIKDKYIKTQQFGDSPATPLPTIITLSALYDYTTDPFKGYPTLTSDQEDELIEASKKSGWFFKLTQPGEKNSAKSIVINNVVYFTSYTPSAAVSCSVEPGNGWLYAVNLALGFKKYDWGTHTDNRAGDDRIKHIGNQFLGAATLISTEVEDLVTGDKHTQGNLIIGKEVLEVGFTLQTMRTSLTIPEN